MSDIIGIYLISGSAYSPTNLGDNGSYGLSKHIYERWENQHLKQFRKDIHPNKVMQNYFNYYGENYVVHTIVEQTEEYELSSTEKLYIKKDNTYIKVNPEGWNLTPGGDGVGDSNSKPYVLKNIETDEIVYGENLSLFASKHPELNRDCLYAVKNGKTKIHKGWINPLLNDS